MTDEIIEENIIPPAPITKGWLRVLASEFDSLNAQWTILAGDCENYTFSRPDADPLYVWARVEHDFITGDIKTLEEATVLGMSEG